MSIQIMGTAHCATDPVIKISSNGKIKAEVPVYVKDIWSDFSTGEVREVSNHFRCVFWGDNAKRAEKLLTKGLEIIITSAKLRTVKNPKNKNITYTQIWVDKWQVPSKVMMTKSLYQEIYQSELLPYKVCLCQKKSNEIRVEVYVDKHAMSAKVSAFRKQPCQIRLQFKQQKKILYQFFLSQENCTFSNVYCDIYGESLNLGCHLNAIESIDSQIVIDDKPTLEHTFLMSECIHREKEK